MTKLRNLILLTLIIFLTSCLKTEKVKTIDWKGHTITFSTYNGGATTAYHFKIEYKRKWIFGKDRLIFWSYSTPQINDISVEDEKLIIHCFAGGNTTNNIIIDLRNINKFIGSPIKYRRDVLEKTNDYYDEPDFIKQNKMRAIKHRLID